MTVIRKQNKLVSDLLLHPVAGMLGGLVVKRYKDKIVLSKPNSKRKRKPTPLQAGRRSKMKEAVTFAKRINADPVKKAAWKKRSKGYSNVYQAAVAFYMKNDEKKSWSLF